MGRHSRHNLVYLLTSELCKYTTCSVKERQKTTWNNELNFKNIFANWMVKTWHSRDLNMTPFCSYFEQISHLSLAHFFFKYLF